MVLDHAIDNGMEGDTKPEDIPEKRGRGIAYLFKQKFNKNISQVEAVELLKARIKERGL